MTATFSVTQFTALRVFSCHTQKQQKPEGGFAEMGQFSSTTLMQFANIYLGRVKAIFLHKVTKIIETYLSCCLHS